MAKKSKKKSVAKRVVSAAKSVAKKAKGDLEKLMPLVIADIFGVNSAESKREQSGIIRE